MNFTLSSLLTVLIFSNLAILLFHYIINSAFLYYKFAFPILFVLYGNDPVVYSSGTVYPAEYFHLSYLASHLFDIN